MAGGMMAGGFTALPLAGVIVLYKGKQLSNNFNENKARQENHVTLKDEKATLVRESYPVAEKDNLIVRTYPKNEKQRILVLNIENADFSNAKKRNINKKLAEIDAGRANEHPYLNDGRDGSEILPKKGNNGDIEYTTYDLNSPPTATQRANGATRDKTRIVIGSDGSACIINQHYDKGSFKKIR